jgi:hypothetical protein
MLLRNSAIKCRHLSLLVIIYDGQEVRIKERTSVHEKDQLSQIRTQINGRTLNAEDFSASLKTNPPS